MELKQLITILTELPPDAVVRNGFGEPMSYRGFYVQLAFEPLAQARIGDMLAHARSCLGRTFTGYTGGDYTMYEHTECWIAAYGETVQYPIHPLETLEWIKECKSQEYQSGEAPVESHNGSEPADRDGRWCLITTKRAIVITPTPCARIDWRNTTYRIEIDTDPDYEELDFPITLTLMEGKVVPLSMEFEPDDAETIGYALVRAAALRRAALDSHHQPTGPGDDHAKQ